MYYKPILIINVCHFYIFISPLFTQPPATCARRVRFDRIDGAAAFGDSVHSNVEIVVNKNEIHRKYVLCNMLYKCTYCMFRYNDCSFVPSTEFHGCMPIGIIFPCSSM